MPYALRTWLGLLVVFGAAGLLFRQQEMALLVALSGVVVAALAADISPRWRPLYQAVSLVFVGLCAAMFIGIAAYFHAAGPEPPLRFILEAYCVAAGVLLAATVIPAAGRAITRVLFRAGETTHALRLAARLMVVGFLLPLPAWFVAQDVLTDPEGALQAFGQLGEAGTVIGYVMLALAAVGFLVRRDTRATLDRLGLGPVTGRHALIILLGVPLLFGLNAGGEWIQHRWLPDLWAADHRMNDAIVSALTPRTMLIVGLSAGIGEEITMRGALQPRLGIMLTSLLFAGLHVQYSWFGMATIFIFGLVLGTIRKRSNTTVVMAVHAIYDIVALFTT